MHPVMADEQGERPGLSLAVAGNRLTLLADGPERLDALLELIDSARESLRFLYYMFMDDVSGTRVRDALIAAAGRGVKVSLLVDGFGSTANQAFFRPLEEAGIAFCRFSPNYGRRYLLRNHQKLALADGQSGHHRRLQRLGRLFRNPRIGGLARHRAARRGRRRRLPRGLFRRAVPLDPIAPRPGPRPSPDAPAKQRHHRPAPLAVRRPRSAAEPVGPGGPPRHARARRLDLIAAYFAPSPGMLRRLAGVVRGARTGAAGHRRQVGQQRHDRSGAKHLLVAAPKRGVEIFEYRPTKLHTKLFVVDDVVHIGSANFDMRSLFLNLEMMLRVDDPGFAAAMRRFVDGEVANSDPVTLESHRRNRTWLNRLRWAIGYFIVAVADYRIAKRLNFRDVGLPRR
jgi:cardiolipin synthase